MVKMIASWFLFRRTEDGAVPAMFSSADSQPSRHAPD
jgi:hypothetical protein